MRHTGSHEQPSARPGAHSRVHIPPPRWLYRRPAAELKRLGGGPLAALTPPLREQRLALLPAPDKCRILVLDSRGENVPEVIAAHAGKLRIVLLDRDLDGVTQIAHHLQDRASLNELLIAAADTMGTLSLGNTELTVANLYAYEEELGRIGRCMAPGGRIRLLGRGGRTDRNDGALLVMLARMTGVTVEAAGEPAHLAASWAVPWRDRERASAEDYRQAKVA